MNQCMTIAFTGSGCGKSCDEVLDGCYARCEHFHGGDYTPLSLQKEAIRKEGSGLIRQDRFDE